MTVHRRRLIVTATVILTATVEFSTPPQYGAGLIRQFFLNPWLAGYEAGFIRRGLLGHVSHNLIVIHALAIGVVAALVAVLLTAVGKLTAEGWPRTLAQCAVALSPVTAVWIDTVGDPLHIALLIAILALPLTRRSPLAGLAVIGLAALLHEASLLLLAPVLLWTAPTWPRRAALACALLIGLLAIARFGAISPAQKTALLPTMTASWSPEQPPVYQTRADAYMWMTFNELVAEEDWQLAPGYLAHRAIWLLRALIVPALLTGLLWLLNRSAATEILWRWIVLLAVTIPLLIVGHDWGRFAVYTWLLAIMTCVRPGTPAPRVPISAMPLAAAVVLCWPFSDTYRIDGMPVAALGRLAMIGIVVAAAWLAVRGRAVRVDARG